LHDNALVLAGLGPGALIVGAAVSLALWNKGADEREFLRLCRIYRTLSHNPQLTCTFKAAA
jgi:hypothetical protein